MAADTDEILYRVERLLDVLFGADVIGRVEPRESGPVGTHEPCLGHNQNRAVWGYCPACEGEGLVKSRSGTIDPYLLAPYGVASEAPPTLDPPRPQMVSEPISMSVVERQAIRNVRLSTTLTRLERLIARAPEWVVDGLVARERNTLKWLATRLPFVPRV